MATDWTEIEPGIWVADDAPAWTYHDHPPQLNGVTAGDYRRSVEMDAADKGDIWVATWAYTESGRVIPIEEITKGDPSVMITAEGWPQWVRARLTRPPRRNGKAPAAIGAPTLFDTEEDTP